MLPISTAAALGFIGTGGGGRWLPASVLFCVKPKHLWTAEEHAAAEAAADSEHAFEPPVEPRLLGAWADIDLWPAAWGHGSVALHAYSVKLTRIRCLQLRAIDADPSYDAYRGLRPRLWEPQSEQLPSQPSSANPSLQAANWGWCGGSEPSERHWEGTVRRRCTPLQPPSSQYGGPELDSPALRKSSPRDHPLERAVRRRLEEAAASAIIAAPIGRQQHLQSSVWQPAPQEVDRAKPSGRTGTQSADSLAATAAA